jgi:hypothetical protein
MVDYYVRCYKFLECSIHNVSNEQASVAVMIMSSIQDVLDSNPGRYIDCPHHYEWTPFVKKAAVLSELQSPKEQVAE